MTDKQLDELLRASLDGEEVPPEIPTAFGKAPPKRVWLGAIAACLCLVLSAGAFLFMDFGGTAMESEDMLNQKAPLADTAPPAAPESATGSAVFDGTFAPMEPMAPAAMPAAPLNGAVGETCSPSSSANRWWQAMKAAVKPRFDIDDYETNYVVMGDTERYHSILVTKAGDSAYYTVDKTTCELMTLEALRKDESLKVLVICRSETADNATELKQSIMVEFYVNQNGDLVICE